ncbi:uncharacterized protein RHOBADRAFT_53147 [Rhodotorula graminis WP1]|uniref:J domain-containing protein n=1 Tax=Rhodotorula graminis (strain WP1) TaxID=578459 RepID=A0A194S3N8_RHOGW|nr:uncharacterized protein RHOBADRAFT_53147 [Rhodotorula graminis WP1]KPV75120.1 hypothetical protein RHOBADRAFT_53147 [Rhodotorula graminis WP1]
MAKKNGRRNPEQPKPKPPPEPTPKYTPENNPFAVPATPSPPQRKPKSRPPKRSSAPPPPRAPVVPGAGTAPNGRSAASSPSAPVEDPRIAETRALLEKGLVAQAFAALAPSDKARPSTAQLSRIERLSAHVSRFKGALKGQGPSVPWEAKLWRCEALEGAKKWNELENYTSTLLKNAPVDRIEIQLYRTIALYQQCKLEGAIQAVKDIGLEGADEATVRKVENLSSRLTRVAALKDSGATAFGEGRYEAAIADYSHALLVDRDNAQLRKILCQNRGMAKLKLGKDLHAAIADFTSALALAPRFVKALKHRADAFAQLGQLSLALDDLERAVEAAQEGAEKRALVGERDAVRRRMAEEKQRKEREEEERRWKDKQAERKDHYKILGVDRHANDAELKKAYRSMSLKHHPDKGGSQEAFVQVTESYQVLSDDRRRRMYDEGSSDDPGSAAQGSPFFRRGDDSDGMEEFGIPFPFVFQHMFAHMFAAAEERGGGGRRGGGGGARGARGGRRGRGGR